MSKINEKTINICENIADYKQLFWCLTHHSLAIEMILEKTKRCMRENEEKEEAKKLKEEVQEYIDEQFVLFCKKNNL